MKKKIAVKKRKEYFEKIFLEREIKKKKDKK